MLVPQWLEFGGRAFALAPLLTRQRFRLKLHSGMTVITGRHFPYCFAQLVSIWLAEQMRRANSGI